MEARPLEESYMELVKFLYECIMIRFGYSLEMVINQRTNFINKVVETLISWFVINHKKTNYKLNINGLVKWANHTFYYILFKDVKLQVHT